jgi:hypothetical protein
VRHWVGSCFAVCLPFGCTPANVPAPVSPGGVPEQTLRVAPPESAAPVAAPPSAETAAPVVRGELECVQPPDPEFDKESPWHKEIGERLDRALPTLRGCAAELPRGEEALVTLRMIYQKDGSPLSQHVVSSTPNGCAVTECLKQKLGRVQSPQLVIEEASYDIALVIKAGAEPQRSDEPPEVLPEDGELAQGATCIDPAIVRLSEAKVQEIVSSSFDELKRCYGEALMRNHSASGKVTFEFVIGHGGEVAVAAAREATLYDCPAISCMLDQFRALRFPEPVGRSVRILYPINYVVEQAPVTLR